MNKQSETEDYAAFDKGFEQGIQAYRKDLKLSDCPFEVDSLEALGWQTGLEEGAMREQVIEAESLGCEAGEDRQFSRFGVGRPCPFITSRLKEHWIRGWIKGAALDEPGLHFDW